MLVITLLHCSIVINNRVTVFVVTLCGTADTHTAAMIKHSACRMLKTKSKLSVSRLANSKGSVEEVMERLVAIHTQQTQHKFRFMCS